MPSLVADSLRNNQPNDPQKFFEAVLIIPAWCEVRLVLYHLYQVLYMPHLLMKETQQTCLKTLLCMSKDLLKSCFERSKTQSREELGWITRL